MHEDAHGALRIWGLVNSGRRWLRDIQGGRRAGAQLPDVPVVHVDAPGSLAVYRAQKLVAKLRSGRISGTRVDQFASAWLPERFTDFLEDLIARHVVARERSDLSWAPLTLDLPREIAERMMKRVIALMREARHGGSIIFVPTDAGAPTTDEPYIDLKYRFETSPTKRWFPEVVVSILNRLAQIHGAGPRPVGWREFETTLDDDLATLDEALFETAHLIAELASTDGAVVMTKLHDIVGFGGMISGRLPAVRRVARALDLDAGSTVDEPAENVGARHRSAYRLVAAVPGAIVIVVSQDGGVRFVAQRDGRVTYWEQE
ncbi:MAG: DNA integrity scanning protein DisA nucleotide-binding domain protein [Deltaproteobacteria bacterium]|nr:DNA integrity scanning protein DisA nucleotide-binding domain protein [Deltaproteobacteria bacterium]